FPYPEGEFFLEDEIDYWANSEFSSVTLLPLSENGPARPIPPNISVDRQLISRRGWWHPIWLCRAITSKIIYREFIFLYKKRKLNFHTLIRAIALTSKVLFILDRLESVVNRLGPIDLIYCYWNDASAYAASIIRKKDGVRYLVSR